ncbi:MAG: hypothetical protein ACM3VT_20020 [Solirubrobacterales bacterium]
MMSNPLSCQSVDFGLLHPADRVSRCYGGGSRVIDPQEPIYVHVRVRQYGGSLPETLRGRSEKPDFGRLPVGTILDCYV